MGVLNIFKFLGHILYCQYYRLIVAKLSLIHLFLEIFTKFNKFNIEAYPDRPGDVAVITGGEMGIGYHITKKLLQKNFRVLMGVVDLEAGREAVDSIRKGGVITGKVELLRLDLASLKSVRSFAQAVLMKTNQIHLLFNNAGVLVVPYTLTLDNMESQFQVNYLSHFLLTNLLLPCMVRTETATGISRRIVNTASLSNYGGSLNFKDLQHREIYSHAKAYCDSKLAIVISTKYLDQKLVSEGTKVRVYSLHPGCIPTGMWDSLGWLAKFSRHLVKYVLLTPDQAAQSIMYAALSPDLESRGGLYLRNGRDQICNPLAYDVKLQQNLWNISLRLTGLNASEDISTKEYYTEPHLSGNRKGEKYQLKRNMYQARTVG